jgi:anti-anti-sigma factor
MAASEQEVVAGASRRGPEISTELRPDGLPYAAVISLRGEQDLASCPAVASRLGAIFGNVLVDLSDCTFIDSSMIGVLVTRARELMREGHRIELVAPRNGGPVARVFEIVRMAEVMGVHDRMPARVLAGDSHALRPL